MSNPHPPRSEHRRSSVLPFGSFVMVEIATAQTSDRSLPHNLEAERCVLGAILIHNEAFNVAAELIDSNDFFRDAHRRVFDKMVGLNEHGQVIDFVTLKDELGRTGISTRSGDRRISQPWPTVCHGRRSSNIMRE